MSQNQILLDAIARIQTTSWKAFLIIVLGLPLVIHVGNLVSADLGGIMMAAVFSIHFLIIRRLKCPGCDKRTIRHVLFRDVITVFGGSRL